MLSQGLIENFPSHSRLHHAVIVIPFLLARVLLRRLGAARDGRSTGSDLPRALPDGSFFTALVLTASLPMSRWSCWEGVEPESCARARSQGPHGHVDASD